MRKTTREHVKTVSDVMSPQPLALTFDQTAADAARLMRDSDVGDVLVTESGELCGIVTDRDLVVRCIAEGRDPETTALDEICSTVLITLAPDSRLDDAIAIMCAKTVRRLPIVDGRTPIGIVSIGDLALAVDRESVLGKISAAPPNR
jgi:CBS domain-containing protein